MIQTAIEKHEAGRDNDRVRQSSLLGGTIAETTLTTTSHGARQADKRKLKEIKAEVGGYVSKYQRLDSSKPWMMQDQTVFDKGGWNAVPETMVYEQEILHKNRLFSIMDEKKCKYTATKVKCEKCAEGGTEPHAPKCIFAKCKLCNMIGHYSWQCHQKKITEILSPKKEGKPKKAST
jgi:hypothetical protein